MRTYFTTGEVARILDLSGARLRSCLRSALYLTGQMGPREFTFQDLLLLRTTKGLLDAEVPISRIRKMLYSLKRQLPEDQQLWKMRFYADGRRVVVWDGNAHGTRFGPILFDFEPLVWLVSSPQTACPHSNCRLDGRHWFDLAIELEKIP